MTSKTKLTLGILTALDVRAYVRASERNCYARRGAGAVSNDGWRVGNL